MDTAINIKINNSLIHKYDLQDTKSIERAVSKLKTHSVIQEYICKLSHQDGFLTAGENYTAYSLLEKKGIQIQKSNCLYGFTDQKDGSVRLKEQFDVVGYFKRDEPETKYTSKKGIIAKVTTETTIQLDPNNPKKLVKHTLNSYRVDTLDSKLSKDLFNKSLVTSIKNAIKSALTGLSKLFNFSRSSKAAIQGEWINPEDQSIEPSWKTPKGRY